MDSLGARLSSGVEWWRGGGGGSGLTETRILKVMTRAMGKEREDVGHYAGYATMALQACVVL